MIAIGAAALSKIGRVSKTLNGAKEMPASSALANKHFIASPTARSRQASCRGMELVLRQERQARCRNRAVEFSRRAQAGKSERCPNDLKKNKIMAGCHIPSRISVTLDRSGQAKSTTITTFPSWSFGSARHVKAKGQDPPVSTSRGPTGVAGRPWNWELQCVSLCRCSVAVS